MARMTFRLTNEMREWLEKQAEQNGRTMNGEIVESIRKLMEGTAEQAAFERGRQEGIRQAINP